LKTTENTHPKRKISHPSKIWRKKIFRKKFIGSDTPAAKPPQGGYGIDLQVVTLVQQPGRTPFVNKNKFFSTTIEFRNLYNKISLQMTSTKIS
jgi:hypothetical protein